MADPQTLPPGVARRLITAVRAKDKREALAILITRRAFVDCIVADPSTMSFGTRPGENTRVATTKFSGLAAKQIIPVHKPTVLG